MCDLAIRHVSGNYHDPATAAFDQRRIVGRLATSSMSSAQHRRPECLGSLHRHQRRPRRRVDDDVVGIDPFDRVGNSDARHGGVCSVAYRTNHSDEQILRRKWAHSVVHTHDCCLGWHGRKPGSH